MVGEPEDRGPVRGLVGPDPLEDAGAVVQPVGGDVHARVLPRDELAVHPDLLGLTHGRPPSTRCYVWSLTASIGTARDRRSSSVEESAAMCLVEPAPIQTIRCWSSERSRKTAPTFLSGKGATAPGSSP